MDFLVQGGIKFAQPESGKLQGAAPNHPVIDENEQPVTKDTWKTDQKDASLVETKNGTKVPRKDHNR